MIVKADRQTLAFPEARSFTVLGDPGCDGLGAENLDTFVSSLAAASGDLIFLLGDIVPIGAEQFYSRLAEVIPHGTGKPILALKGNHDKENYDAHFGLPNYAVIANDFSIILIDNSSGTFSNDSLDFLSLSLETLPGRSIVVMFHIPPPNYISGNSVPMREWERFIEAAGGRISRISAFVAGHVHSYFEDSVNGIPLIATGGAGARIEHIDRARTLQNHIVEFSPTPEHGFLHFRRDINAGGRAGSDLMVKKLLMQSFAEECATHVGYLMQAEDAEQQELPNLAKLYRAAAESELRHARNLRHITSKAPDYITSVRNAIDSERLESEQTYRSRYDIATQASDILSAKVFADAIAAERVHRDLFEKAIESVAEGKDIEPAKYHTCSSCGMTFVGPRPPNHCPICGAPASQIPETR